ncbi:hypothetical protein Cs7R123_65030 [Catellatospora sp. TT07R-123]|uniref:hypothetical protein n=1 Tax=Catellatospora sp. TT07R-123 TaxID=2733863 RepID=UPI001B173412|nr:hypothetical protein [Catellatospora sp. TT07R-123]GHJ49161.1 hypothetical protein Cs7R123_65030 [Catellatospora sp. TT07R-123]
MSGTLLERRRASARTPEQARPERLPRVLAWSVAAGAAATLLAVLALLLRELPTGSRLGGWTYPYVRAAGSWAVLWPAVPVIAAVLGLLVLSRRLPARLDAAAVTGWLVAAVPLQLLLRWYAPSSLAGIVVSDRANSFYSPTRRWSAGEFIRGYHELVEQLPPHARTNMPGKTMLYYLLDALGLTPAGMGTAVLVLSNLAALLLYLVVRDLTGDRRLALYALVLCLFAPGRLHFVPILNAVAPVPILLALWLHVRFLRTRHRAYALGLGAAVYLTLFFEPSPLILGLVFAALLAFALRGGSDRVHASWADTARLAALAVAGFAACLVAMRLLFGYDIVAGFEYVLADANRFNDRWRPYGMWVTRNLWYFVLCAGFASCALLPAAAWASVRRVLVHPMALLTLSGLAVLALLDLLGMNRGETVRLWIFIAVFLELPAAWLCARTTRLWPFAVVTSALILQAAAATAMIGFVQP